MNATTVPNEGTDALAQVHSAARHALQLMREQGFEHAQVNVVAQRRSELCLAHNEASLLRSTATHKLQLVGLHDTRRAACEASNVDPTSLQAAVQGLWSQVAAAPQDPAHAVSSGQHLLHQPGGAIETGDSDADTAPINDTLAQAMAELLAWRAAHTPRVMLEEALAGCTTQHSCLLTSGGSELLTQQRWYDASVFALARGSGADSHKTSSFNTTQGTAARLQGRPIQQQFGFQGLMEALERQLDTQPLGARFQGAVVLTPAAVATLLSWLLGQLGPLSDQPLIDGSSIYLQRVGQPVASSALTLTSRFDAPGLAPITADGFVAAPLQPLTQGRLNLLMPSLYASRKTGLPHVPATAQGWELAAGTPPLAALVAQVPRGALVDRLSMGRPAANGDFSGVIKNSFAIHHGQLGPALSETMITGNVAHMLRDVQAASAERIDTGTWVLPWLLVPGLHFS